MNRTATASWPTEETSTRNDGHLAAAPTDAQRKPQRCSGNLSVSQPAVEANVKYWVVAQRQSPTFATTSQRPLSGLRAARRHALIDDND